MVICYQLLGQPVSTIFSVQTLKIGYPEKSVRNCHFLLRSNPEDHSSHLLHCRSLKSQSFNFTYTVQMAGDVILLILS